MKTTTDIDLTLNNWIATTIDKNYPMIEEGVVDPVGDFVNDVLSDFWKLAESEYTEFFEPQLKTVIDFNLELSADNRVMIRVIEGVFQYLKAVRVADKEDPTFLAFETHIQKEVESILNKDK